MPSISQLEYVVALDQYRHFGKASESCHVSQPSLSMQVQKLEEELMVSVFDRSRKPIIPTPEGKAIISQARMVLHEYQKLLDLSQSVRGELKGPFSIGVIPTLAPYLIPLFVEEFCKEHPNVTLQIHELKTEELVSQLERDQIDVGLLVTPLHLKRIKEKVLFYESFWFYGQAGHQLLKQKKIKEKDLDQPDIWLLQDGHCMRGQVLRICKLNQNGKEGRRVQFESGNLETLRKMVQTTKGFTLLPELMVNQMADSEKERHVRPIQSPTPVREVSMVYLRDRYKEKFLSALEAVILTHLPKNLRQRTSQKQQVIDL